MSAVSPREGEQQDGEEEQEGKEDLKERFTRVFGESVEDTLDSVKDAGEEANTAGARRTEAVPSTREVEEHNLEHSVGVRSA